jgi:uncharacterized protein involved in type VI secretion and phage assembly
MGLDFTPADVDEPDNDLYGVYVGTVKDLQDPKNMGRVKVTFPWRDADDMSTWARMAVPMAGKKMGTYFLPEKNDEVLVAFGNGDIHDPYIVGALWTGKAKPALQNKKKNPKRQIKSRAGHTITFDDTKDKGGITIETGHKTHTVDLSAADESVTIKDSNGNTVTMDKNGIALSTDKTLSLSGKNVEISAKQGVTISAKKSIKASAKSQMALQSKGKLDLKSKGMLNIKGKGMLKAKTSGIMKLKGSMVMIN